jgi:hypothetical protein
MILIDLVLLQAPTDDQHNEAWNHWYEMSRTVLSPNNCIILGTQDLEL